MKIAVASQNRKEITGHTGMCRKFWIYAIENDAIAGKEMLGVVQTRVTVLVKNHQIRGTLNLM